MKTAAEIAEYNETSLRNFIEGGPRTTREIETVMFNGRLNPTRKQRDELNAAITSLRLGGTIDFDDASQKWALTGRGESDYHIRLVKQYVKTKPTTLKELLKALSERIQQPLAVTMATAKLFSSGEIVLDGEQMREATMAEKEERDNRLRKKLRPLSDDGPFSHIERWVAAKPPKHRRIDIQSTDAGEWRVAVKYAKGKSDIFICADLEDIFEHVDKVIEREP